MSLEQLLVALRQRASLVAVCIQAVEALMATECREGDLVLAEARPAHSPQSRPRRVVKRPVVRVSEALPCHRRHPTPSKAGA